MNHEEHRTCAYERQLGRRACEQIAADAFARSCSAFTRRSIEITDEGESPDFWIKIDGRLLGLEVTEVRGPSRYSPFSDPREYLDAFAATALKKQESYERRGIFDQRIVLVGYSSSPPLWDMKRDALSGAVVDFTDFRFAEIWLLDQSDDYSGRPFADLICLAPHDLRGFYEDSWVTRKPFG